MASISARMALRSTAEALELGAFATPIIEPERQGSNVVEQDAGAGRGARAFFSGVSASAGAASGRQISAGRRRIAPVSEACVRGVSLGLARGLHDLRSRDGASRFATPRT